MVRLRDILDGTIDGYEDLENRGLTVYRKGNLEKDLRGLILKIIEDSFEAGRNGNLGRNTFIKEYRIKV